MDDETRVRVWNAILARPGITKTELTRDERFSWGTVAHHLHVLEREGRIELIRFGRTVHAAPTELVQIVGRGSILTCPDARRILGMLLQGPFACGTTELGRTLQLSRKQVRRHLYELVKEGLAKSDGAYHPRYLATPSGTQMACSIGLDKQNHPVLVRKKTIKIGVES